MSYRTNIRKRIALALATAAAVTAVSATPALVANEPVGAQPLEELAGAQPREHVTPIYVGHDKVSTDPKSRFGTGSQEGDTDPDLRSEIEGSRPDRLADPDLRSEIEGSRPDRLADLWDPGAVPDDASDLR